MRRKEFSTGNPVHLRVHYASHRGLVRSKNEDSMRIGSTVITGGMLDTVLTTEIELARGTWIAVADGLGGHGSGEVASAIAVQSLESPERFYDDAGIRNIGSHIMNRLRSEASTRDVSRSMGTTLSALCFHEEAIYLVHVGDSRIYSLPDLIRLTRDDTAVQDLIEKGEISEQMRSRHPLKHRLTRCFAADASTPALSVKRLPLENRFFLLCSDGLWENLSDDEMREYLASLQRQGKGPREFAGWLLQTALQRGGADNISLIVTEP